MIVVADSSPLIVLIGIRHVDVLQRLFEQVLIPPEVMAELNTSSRSQAVRDFIVTQPPWLIERAPSVLEVIPTTIRTIHGLNIR
jgi:predicted nucleic acid-binding protein